jgi:hypothetical protein
VLRVRPRAGEGGRGEGEGAPPALHALRPAAPLACPEAAGAPSAAAGRGGGAGPAAAQSSALWQGQAVHVVGSPFGALAPWHFANCVIGGAVQALLWAPGGADGGGGAGSDTGGAGAWAGPRRQGGPWLGRAGPAGGGGGAAPGPPAPAGPAMMLLDTRCLPGMEGGPVLSAGGGGGGGGAGRAAPGGRVVLGVLCPPLTRRSDGAQLQAALAWGPVWAALQRHLAAGRGPSGCSSGGTQAVAVADGAALGR